MPSCLFSFNLWFILAAFFAAETACSQAPATPENFAAMGYENHVDLQWSPVSGASTYQIFRSTDSGAFDLLQTVPASEPTIATDWTGDEGQSLTRWYKIKAVSAAGQSSNFSPIAAAQTAPMTDEQLLDMAQRATFRFFWEFAHPVSGMARDRNNGDDNIVTSGGTGFGIMATCVAAERGWISRQSAVNQLIKVVSFLQVADRFHGVFPHFMDGTTGDVIPFSQYDDGADLVETAFLMQGLLAARQYFDENTPLEIALRDVITGLWEDVEWDWFRRNGGPVLYWHWSPNFGWQMNFPLRGFNETHIVYLLAIASPTHPVPASLYTSGWTSSGYANNATHWGYKLYCGPPLGGPLFFAHYSYLGFDPRHLRDQFCNYFVRNRNHSFVNRQACIVNTEHHAGYSADCWGLTASDNPWGYLAHDPLPSNDNGTIAPTAALSSMPYTPDESMAALRHFYRNLGERLWGVFGFRDAFNLDQNWFAPSFLAIDQGPIVCMMENYRTGLLWEKFMANPEIQPALDAIGFVPDNSSSTDDFAQTGFSATIFPNPAGGAGEPLALEINLLRGAELSATMTDINGRPLRQAFIGRAFTAGIFREKIETAGLAAGVYFLKINASDGRVFAKKIIVQP